MYIFSMIFETVAFAMLLLSNSKEVSYAAMLIAGIGNSGRVFVGYVYMSEFLSEQ